MQEIAEWKKMPCGDSEELNLLVYIMAYKHQTCFLHESGGPERAVTAQACAATHFISCIACHSSCIPQALCFVRQVTHQVKMLMVSKMLKFQEKEFSPMWTLVRVKLKRTLE